MSKWFFIILAVLALSGGAGWYYWTYYHSDSKQEQRNKNAGPSGGQQAVDVGFITTRPVFLDQTNELPGRVVAYQVAEIRPQVSGIITSRLFEEGSYVEEGQQLYQIDPSHYDADYQIAQANLQDAKARVRNTQNLVKRFEKLVDFNAVSQQEYDEALASMDQAKAAVSLAEAQVKSAKINLDYTKVYAPISGYISPSSVTKGALVTAQQEMALATVRQLDPVYVDLSQSAAETLNLRERLAASRLQNDKTRYEVSLYFGNTAQSYPQKGTLDATDLAVDTQTGAIRLRSLFPNPDNILLPGMFVRASIEDIGRAKEIIVPHKSVNIQPDGEKTVWVIGPDDKAEKRTIQVGAAYENNWIVQKGLEGGERLIVEGLMKLREGAALKPQEIEGFYDAFKEQPSTQTSQDSAPMPQNSKSDKASNKSKQTDDQINSDEGQ